MEQQGDPLDLENWYNPLREFTFETSFLPLTLSDLEGICNVHDKKCDVSALSDLKERIAAVMTTGNGAFVKLSTRSCKDWALRSSRTKRLFLEEQAKLNVGDHGGNEDVRDVIAIVRSMSFALRVQSPEEVVEMLVASERSYQDCVRRSLAGNIFPMQLVVRQWEAIQPELELRGFVFRKRLTALTQYYKACYSPMFVLLKDRIRAAALAVFNKMASRLSIDAYVLDLVYLPEKDVCLVIELNHFAKTTSPSLFNWEQDIEVLENGPFEFRFVAAPIENVRAQIAAPLRVMAGWPPVASSSGNSGVALSSAAAPAKLSKSRVTGVGRLLEKEARKWQPVAPLSDATVAALEKLMQRRSPQPFFTPGDVSLLPCSRPVFLRVSEDAAIEAESCFVPTVYVTLFARVAGKPLLGPENTLNQLSKAARTSKTQLALDFHNSALVLRELGLVVSSSHK